MIRRKKELKYVELNIEYLYMIIIVTLLAIDSA